MGDPTGADRLLRDLEAASRVKHPCVAGIEKTGRARFGQGPGAMQVTYAVMEPTEEELAEVLRHRVLTAEEAAQLAASLVWALSAIHELGLYHGQVAPANVLASGDTVKLSGHCVRRCSAEARAELFAQDVGDLGATLFEALTRRKLTSAQDPAIAKLPAPFRSIVQSAVSGRWGLAEIALALKTPTRDAIRHPIPNSGGASRLRFAEEMAAKGVQRMRHAVRKFAPGAAQPPAIDRGAAAGVHRDLRRSLLTVLATVSLLAASSAWLFHHTWTVAATAVTPRAALPAGAPAASVSDAAPAVPTSPVSGTATLAAANHPVWRVVAYAFGDQAAAERQSQQLAAGHPEWKPEVFRPTAHGVWLVTLGGAMDRDRAVALRNQVRAAGPATDAYAQNYSH